MNKFETAEMLAYLCSAYPQVVIRKENAEMYHACLEDLEFSDVKKVLHVLIMESKWFPSVAQIRNAVGEVNGDVGPSVGEAWAEVLKQASQIGQRGKPSFSHPAVEKAVASIGWAHVCMGNLESVRIQFSQVYKRRVAPLPQLAAKKEIGRGNESF